MSDVNPSPSPHRVPLRPRAMRVAKVSLRVHDIDRSAAFYRAVLGCEERATSGGVCMSLAEAQTGEPDAIELVTGRSITGMPALDSFTVEAPSPEAVDLIHASALQEDVRVLPVRETDGTRQCVIFDPDGNKVEVFARIDLAAQH